MRTRFSLAMLSSARVLSSIILAGKRDFRLHSTSSFSEYVVVAKLLSYGLKVYHFVISGGLNLL